MIEFKLDNRRIVLIDTPGFDDDVRSDVVIFEDIAKWFAKRGLMGGRVLDGVIFLHPISLNRVGGSERKRTRLLEKIIGSHAYDRVVIATTMWDDMKSKESMESRMQGRLGAGGVWHNMCNKGATIVRHHNNKESAHHIIRMIINKADKRGKIEPLLQTELRNEQGHVGKTSAGKELRSQLETDIRLLKKELENHQKDRPPASYKRDKNHDRRKEWKEWHKDREMMEDRLALRERQLKKLGSMVVSRPYPNHVLVRLYGGTNCGVRRFGSRGSYPFSLDEGLECIRITIVILPSLYERVTPIS